MRPCYFFLHKFSNKLGNTFFPRYFTWIAKMKFQSIDIKYGKGLYVDGKIILSVTKGKLSLGENVKILSRYKANLVGMTNPATFQIFQTGSIILGDGVGMSSTIFSSKKLIKIGNNVMIGANVRIFDHDFHSMNFLDRRHGGQDYLNAKTAEVIIEDDVFIGTNSIILKGVHIGKGSIVGAGSVVSMKEIPSFSVVAGNPCKIIKTSNSEKS
jgi:acetyltransferase-like isoleucine patch superfamily enzyme